MLLPAMLLNFLESGGKVLGVILVVAFVMWFLIIERYLHFFFSKNSIVVGIEKYWAGVEDKRSWGGRKIRAYCISVLRRRLEARLDFIRVLVNTSMLLGLLGTITGMIQVFEGLALVQAGSVRIIANSVSQTVIPALSGLVTALSGLYFAIRLKQLARREVRKLTDKLRV